MQEEFASCASLRGAAQSTGVVARASCRVHRDIESLRGRMGGSERRVENMFGSLLALSFVEGLSESFEKGE